MNAWTIIGITLMACLTAIAIAMIATQGVPRVTVNTAAEGIVDAPVYAQAAAGAGMGSCHGGSTGNSNQGGGCGCGG